MISLKNVSKSYGGKIKAVDNISFEVRPGEIFGFLGPNGAGKTTTIKIITGILSADSGNVKISGHDIVEDPLSAKMCFGFVPDDPNIFPRLKGIEYLKFICDIYNVPDEDRVSRIQEFSKRFGISDALNDKIQSFSHGMRQKLLVTGALIHNPDVWILDEPMTGLDPKSSFELKEMMRKHADSGKSVFFSTHVLEVAEKICDRIAVINKGVILFCGTVDELKEKFKSDAQNGSHSNNDVDDDSLESIFLSITE